jgi:hypothetical protein
VSELRPDHLTTRREPHRSLVSPLAETGPVRLWLVTPDGEIRHRVPGGWLERFRRVTAMKKKGAKTKKGGKARDLSVKSTKGSDVKGGLSAVKMLK